MEVLIFIANILILFSIWGIALLVKNYLPSYITEKGKNLATKEDVAEITREAEKVRTEFAVQLGKINRGHQRHTEKLAKIETLYTDNMALLDKCIRYTKNRADYNELTDELARNDARMRLLSTKDILEQSGITSNIIYQWSREYRAGMPKMVGDTGMGIISNTDFRHTDKAEELFPKVNEEINKLNEMMKDHLRSIEAEHKVELID